MPGSHGSICLECVFELSWTQKDMQMASPNTFLLKSVWDGLEIMTQSSVSKRWMMMTGKNQQKDRVSQCERAI
jgi:hypothetical protein